MLGGYPTQENYIWNRLFSLEMDSTLGISVRLGFLHLAVSILTQSNGNERHGI